MMLAERCGVRATMGDIEGAREDAEAVKRMLPETGFGMADFWARWSLAFLETSLGNSVAASEAVDPVAVMVEALGGFFPVAAIVLADKPEALAAAGELDRALSLADMFEAYGHRHGVASAVGIASRARAQVLAAQGDQERALAEAERALAGLEKVGMPLEVGRSLLVKGQIERRAKRRVAARDSFERALKEFERIGARLWADRARAELVRTGMRRASSGDLTPTEQRVAELATQGLTAKQIGEAIFLSPKTVEANLTRIYAKLAIRSRAELGRVMAERERAGAATGGVLGGPP
jgi:DNA-binding CsgD family transcriptional regulator